MKRFDTSVFAKDGRDNHENGSAEEMADVLERLSVAVRNRRPLLSRQTIPLRSVKITEADEL